jgi:malonyl-ACP decarboxylase
MRPRTHAFDRLHDGFIYGESCGAVVVERLERARSAPYAALTGWSFITDGHRDPDPSLAGEVQAISAAMQASGLAARDIDYINPHGTGSRTGDHTELSALKACGMAGTAINATKSILGHGLSSAGTVEVIATLLQMRNGYLHSTRNLQQPIDDDFRWVRGEAVAARVNNALCTSFGFGGISSAICLKNLT